MRTLALLVIAGCWRAGSPPVALSNTAKPQSLMTMTSSGLGPIGAETPATLGGLRAALAGYEVRPVNDGGLEYDVFAGTEKLLFVVPNDDGTVFNVHATSGRIGVADRPWRVGQAFQDSHALSTCECWGENPTCYKRGDHIAVNFKRSCEGLTDSDPRALRVLDGVAVQRVIWSPTAFGDSGATGGQGYGGDSYGGANPCGGGDPCGGD